MDVAMDSSSGVEPKPNSPARPAAPCAFPLLSLPPELISAVLAFGSSRDLLTCVVPVAKSLRELVLEDRPLWSRMAKQRFGIHAGDQHTEDADDQTMEAPADRPADWFVDEATTSTGVSSSSASVPSSAAMNPLLRTFRSFTLTPPRPLKLRILHVDDRGYSTHIGISPEVQLRNYHVNNILRPEGKAYSSDRCRNVHIVMALGRSAKEEAETMERDPHADLNGLLLQQQLAAAASAGGIPTPIPPTPAEPLPSSFLLTDLKVIAPSTGYTAPLSSGLIFFTMHLPTPTEIAAWDDWSEAQWQAREEALSSEATKQERLHKESTLGIEKGEAEISRSALEREAAEAEEAAEEKVDNWYDDTLQRSAKPTRVDSFPLTFTDQDDDERAPSSASSSAASRHVHPLAPLVAFFRLEDNGLVLESSPEPMQSPPTPAEFGSNTDTEMTDDESVASSQAASVSSVAPTDGAAASSSPAPSAASSSSSTWRSLQSPHSYRHHFARPIHGRFIVLTLLRSSGPDQENIDVSYIGVKGYRRGMKHADVGEALSAAAAGDFAAPPSVDTTAGLGLGEGALLSSSASSSSPSPVLDPAYDAFDFDQPLSANVGVTERLRSYLANMQRLGHGMQAEVQNIDMHLERVQAALAAQQRAQQQQQTLRVRILLLQTQQLQLQLANQQLATRVTLARAEELNNRAATFVQQRRNVLDAAEQEREAHRQRLAQLNEEKEREEVMLVALRRRVQEAKEREEDLRSQLQRNQAARDALEAERMAAGRNGTLNGGLQQAERWLETRQNGPEPIMQPRPFLPQPRLPVQTMAPTAEPTPPTPAAAAAAPLHSHRPLSPPRAHQIAHAPFPGRPPGESAFGPRDPMHWASHVHEQPFRSFMAPPPPAMAMHPPSPFQVHTHTPLFAPVPPFAPPSAHPSASFVPAPATGNTTQELLARLRASRLRREEEAQAAHEAQYGAPRAERETDQGEDQSRP